METTLVLDVGYQPIACTTWQTAIVWVLDRVVEVVDEYPDKYIRTPTWQVQMPSIVRFLKPIAKKWKKTTAKKTTANKTTTKRVKPAD